MRIFIVNIYMYLTLFLVKKIFAETSPPLTLVRFFSTARIRHNVNTKSPLLIKMQIQQDYIYYPCMPVGISCLIGLTVCTEIYQKVGQVVLL